MESPSQWLHQVRCQDQFALFGTYMSTYGDADIPANGMIGQSR